MSPWSSTVTTNGADEAAELIRQGFGYRVSLSAGDLSYRQHVVAANGIAVSDLHLGATLHLDLEPTDEIMLVQLHRGSYGYNPWSTRRAVGPGGSFLIPPEQALAFDIDHADVSTCSFSTAALRDTARAVYDLDEVTVAEGAALPLDPGKAWLWAQTIESFRSRMLADPALYDDDLIRNTAFRYLIVHAVSSFGFIDVPLHGSHGGTASLRRAIAYIDDNLASPLTVQDIATAARVSPRTLLSRFQQERAQTPMQYVRAGRLAGARSALRSGDPTRGDTVSAIAARWGFSNATRFATRYRQAFGESPRDTLHG